MGFLVFFFFEDFKNKKQSEKTYLKITFTKHYST